MTTPIWQTLFTWTGDKMVPKPRMLQRCRTRFVEGQDYLMEIVQPRNMASHNAYFAELAKAFDNLAEEHAARFKTVDQFRAWALVQTGFCTETDYAYDSPEEAKLAAMIIRARSHYAVIVSPKDSNVVKVFDAESQAVYGPHAMPAKRFEESKTAVLDLAATMARTTRAELTQNAGKAL